MHPVDESKRPCQRGILLAFLKSCKEDSTKSQSRLGRYLLGFCDFIKKVTHFLQYYLHNTLIFLYTRSSEKEWYAWLRFI